VRILAGTPGTHTHAAEQGWDYPATWAEISAVWHTQRFLNLHRDAGSAPLQLPYPWPDTEAVTPEERRVAEEVLERRSAFRS
jgi:hypothetical protein